MTMLRQVLALTIKDIQVLLADRSGLATLFLMPAFFVFLMTVALGGAMFGGPGSPDIEVLLVNQDEGELGAAIVADLEAGSGLAIETAWQGQPVTRELAEALIVDQQRNFAVIIPPDFTTAVETAITEARDPGEASTVLLVTDPAVSAQITGPVQGAISGAIQQVVLREAVVPAGVERLVTELAAQGVVLPPGTADQLAEAAVGGGAGPAPARLETTSPAGIEAPQYPNAVQQSVPGWALFGIFFVSQALALSFLEERKLGTFRRLLAAPLPRAALLLGKLVPFLLLSLAQLAFMFFIGVVIVPLFGATGLELGRHPEALVVISLAAALTATSLGLLLAAVGRTAEQVGGYGSLLIIGMAALGGVMVPRFVMPEPMQQLGLLTPHAWALDAYLDVLVRNQSLGHVLPELAALLAFSAVFFGLALWRLRWT